MRKEMTPLNLDRVQHWIDRGLLNPLEPITMRHLFETRCVHGIKHGVKLLGDVRTRSLVLGPQLFRPYTEDEDEG